MKKDTQENKLSAEKLAGFCEQIQLMLGAGMTIYDGMESLAEGENSEESNLFHTLSERVNMTGSLYEALREDDRFPVYMKEMTKMGEETGRLEEIMQGLVVYYEQEGRTRNAISGAVLYPAILGIMLAAIIAIMLFRVLPIFERVLATMGAGMSQNNTALMQTGEIIGWGAMILICLIAAVILTCCLLMRSSKRDDVLFWIKKMLPPVRNFTKDIAASRIASVVSIMLSSGFTTRDAMEMAPSVITDREASQTTNAMCQSLEDGEPFSDAMKTSNFFEEIHVRMVRLGEMSGRLDRVMEKIAVIYEEKAQDSLDKMVSAIEPALVALLCIVIGAVLLSVMLPMAGILAGFV